MSRRGYNCGRAGLDLGRASHATARLASSLITGSPSSSFQWHIDREGQARGKWGNCKVCMNIWNRTILPIRTLTNYTPQQSKCVTGAALPWHTRHRRQWLTARTEPGGRVFRSWESLSEDNAAHQVNNRPMGDTGASNKPSADRSICRGTPARASPVLFI